MGESRGLRVIHHPKGGKKKTGGKKGKERKRGKYQSE